MGVIHAGRVVAHAFAKEEIPFVLTLCGGHVTSGRNELRQDRVFV